jgi:hypothetical protein
MNLSLALGKQGQADEAIGQLMEAIRLRPDYVNMRTNPPRQ